MEYKVYICLREGGDEVAAEGTKVVMTSREMGQDPALVRRERWIQ